jgi:AcrR family transcriptional regulator
LHNSAVRDIGRAAAMTQGTIYNYGRSKDDIPYLVCDRIVAEYQEQTRKALETTADPAARIRSVVRSRLRSGVPAATAAAGDHSHLPGQPPARAAFAARALGAVQEFIGMFESIVGQALRDRPEPKPNLRLAAHILTLLSVMLALRHWSHYRHLTHEEVIHGLTDFLVRGAIEEAGTG